MTTAQPSVFARDDTFFGICQAIGEDFGFSPNWLRLAMGVGLLFAPVATLGAYVAAGVVVGFSRLIAPDPKRTAPAPAEAVPGTASGGQRDAGGYLGRRCLA